MIHSMTARAAASHLELEVHLNQPVHQNTSHLLIDCSLWVKGSAQGVFLRVSLIKVAFLQHTECPCPQCVHNMSLIQHNTGKPNQQHASTAKGEGITYTITQQESGSKLCGRHWHIATECHATSRTPADMPLLSRTYYKGLDCCLVFLVPQAECVRGLLADCRMHTCFDM